MDTQEKPNRADRISDEVSEYIKLRIAVFKLAFVENLSVLLSDAIGLMLLFVTGALGILALTGALIYWLSKVIGSVAGALVIVGVFFILAGLILFWIRHTLIGDRLVKKLSRMFFKSNTEKYDYEEEEDEDQ